LAQIYSAQRQLMTLDQLPRREEELMKEEEEEGEGEEWAEGGQAMQDDEASLHDRFYNEFEYMLNDKDPFLSYDFDFKKKGVEENSEEQLFF
jgi:hypothetical protein